MRKALLAVAAAAAFAGQPAATQQAGPAQPAGTVAVTAAEEPIPLPEAKNRVSPGSFASTTAGIGIVVIGVILLAGVAFLPSQ